MNAQVSMPAEKKDAQTLEQLIGKVNQTNSEIRDGSVSNQVSALSLKSISADLEKLKASYAGNSDALAAIDSWKEGIDLVRSYADKKRPDLFVTNSLSTLEKVSTGLADLNAGKSVTAEVRSGVSGMKMTPLYRELETTVNSAAMDFADNLKKLSDFSDPLNLPKTMSEVRDALQSIWNGVEDNFNQKGKEAKDGNFEKHKGELYEFFQAKVMEYLGTDSAIPKSLVASMLQDENGEVKFNASKARDVIDTMTETAGVLWLESMVSKRYVLGKQIVQSAENVNIDEITRVRGLLRSDILGFTNDDFRDSVLGNPGRETEFYEQILAKCSNYLNENREIASFMLKAFYGANGEVLEGFSDMKSKSGKPIEGRFQNDSGVLERTTLKAVLDGATDLVDKHNRFYDFLRFNVNDIKGEMDAFTSQNPLTAELLLSRKGTSMQTEGGDVVADAFSFPEAYAFIKFGLTGAGSDLSDLQKSTLLEQLANMPSFTKAIVLQNPDTLSYIFDSLGPDQGNSAVSRIVMRMIGLYQQYEFEKRIAKMGEFWERIKGSMEESHRLLDEVSNMGLKESDLSGTKKGIKVRDDRFTYTRQDVSPNVYMNLINTEVGFNFSNPSSIYESMRQLYSRSSFGGFSYPQAGKTHVNVFGGITSDKVDLALQKAYEEVTKEDREKAKYDWKIQRGRLSGAATGEKSSEDSKNINFGGNVATKSGGKLGGSFRQTGRNQYYASEPDALLQRDSGTTDIDASAQRVMLGGVLLQNAILSSIKTTSKDYDKATDVSTERVNQQTNAVLNAALPSINAQMFADAQIQLDETTDWTRFANLHDLFDANLSIVGDDLSQIKNSLQVYSNTFSPTPSDTFYQEEFLELWNYMNRLEKQFGLITLDQRDQLCTYIRGKIEAAGGTIVLDSENNMITGTNPKNCTVTLEEFWTEFKTVTGTSGNTTQLDRIVKQTDLDNLFVMIDSTKLSGKEKEEFKAYLQQQFDENKTATQEGELTRDEYSDGLRALREKNIETGIRSAKLNVSFYTPDGYVQTSFENRVANQQEIKNGFDKYRAEYDSIAGVSDPSNVVSGEEEIQILKQRLDNYPAISETDKASVIEKIGIAVQKNVDAGLGQVITKEQFNGILDAMSQTVELGKEYTHAFARIYNEGLPAIITDTGIELEKQKPRGEYSVEGADIYSRMGYFVGWQTKGAKKLTVANMNIKDPEGNNVILGGLEQVGKRAAIIGYYRYAPTSVQELAGEKGDTAYSVKIAELRKISLLLYGRESTIGKDLKGAELKTRTTRLSVFRFGDDNTYTMRGEAGISIGRLDAKGYYEEKKTGELKTERYTVLGTLDIGNNTKVDVIGSRGNNAPAGTNQKDQPLTEIKSIVTEMDGINLASWNANRKYRQDTSEDLISRVLQATDRVREFGIGNVGGSVAMNSFFAVRKDGRYTLGFGTAEDTYGGKTAVFLGKGNIFGTPNSGLLATAVVKTAEAKPGKQVRQTYSLQYVKNNTELSIIGSNPGLAGEKRTGVGFKTGFGKYRAGADVQVGESGQQVLEVMATNGSVTMFLDHGSKGGLGFNSLGALSNFALLDMSWNVLGQISFSEMDMAKAQKFYLQVGLDSGPIGVEVNATVKKGQVDLGIKPGEYENYQVNATFNFYPGRTTKR